MAATGMALGAGSVVGHMAVQGVAGAMSGGGNHSEGQHAPQQMEQQQQQQAPMQYAQQEYQNPCVTFHSRFLDCMKQTQNQYEVCGGHFDMFLSVNRILHNSRLDNSD